MLKIWSFSTIVFCLIFNQAYGQFSRVTSDPSVSDGGWSFGLSWVDYDNDGFPDIIVSNLDFNSSGELNFLYHNNGDGTYTRITTGDITGEGATVASTWGDFDNDGDVDVYVSCPERINSLYTNNGDGSFSKATSGPLGLASEFTMEAEWVDYDNDGWLDLFVVNHQPSSTPVVTALYHSDNGSFTRLDNIAVGLVQDESNSCGWGDYDNDGDRDLFWSRNDKSTLFFDNDGDGTFTQNTAILIAQSPHKYHANWADYDNDGDLDLYTEVGYPGTPYLCENTGDGNFTQVTGQEISNDVGYWTGGYWGDYNNDGFLDLLIIAHNFYEPYPNRLYHNNGDGTFSRVTEGVIATDNDPSSAAAWADHDRDGDLDLYIANVNNANNCLYINNGNNNHWLQITTVGTSSNRSGIGAKVRLKAEMNGQAQWQLREVSAKNGFMSQGPLMLHFGLGDADIVDSIIVEWPSGIRQVLTDIEANQFLTITEVCCSGSRGNTDCSAIDEPDISDITRLIDFLYISHDPLCCLDEADVDASGGEPDISDITAIISYLYISHNPLSTCPSSSIMLIPRGAGAQIDGYIEPSEWQDADTVHITIAGEIYATILFKHDNINFLCAYIYSFLEDENLCLPELMFDTDNNKSTNWLTDDWWFHISATDCEAQGTYDVYTDCSIVQPDWQGVPNFEMTSDPPKIDTFEVRIPFSKINITPGDTIGIAFRIEYVPYIYGYWPSEAVIENTSTWMEVTIDL